MQINKADFLYFIKQVIDNKCVKAQEYMESIVQSIQAESKSTAGDKHDTTRELMQQERNKAAQNLNNQLLAKKTLIQLVYNDGNKKAGFGSLISTDKGWIFIGLALGKIVFKDIEVICISPLSPLARVLEGCIEKDILSFNAIEYEIQKVI